MSRSGCGHTETAVAMSGAVALIWVFDCVILAFLKVARTVFPVGSIRGSPDKGASNGNARHDTF